MHSTSLSHALSFVMWVHRGGDVPRPQLQPHLIPKHLALHCWSERSCNTPATVPGKSMIIFIIYIHYLDFFGCFCKNTSDALSISPSRYWWTLHASSPCGGWCVGCFCLSAAPRAESSSPAAQSAPLRSSNAAKPWISSLSAGLSIATSCQTHRIPWSARCLDAWRDLMSLEVIFTPSPHYCLRMETHSGPSCFPKIDTIALKDPEWNFCDSDTSWAKWKFSISQKKSVGVFLHHSLLWCQSCENASPPLKKRTQRKPFLKKSLYYIISSTHHKMHFYFSV